MGIGRQRAVSATGSTDRKRPREVEEYGGESDLERRIKSLVWDILSFSAWGTTMRIV